MPIELKISGDSPEDFLALLRTASYAMLPQDSGGLQGMFPEARLGDTVEIEHMREVVAPPADTVIAAGAPPSDAPARRRGRPPKAVAEPAVTTPAEDAEVAGLPPADPASRVFTVRRYGGAIEGEYDDSGTAAEVLIGLIREAHDEQALVQLSAENSEEVKTWPEERHRDVVEAAEAAMRVLKAKAETPAPAAPASGPHFAVDGTPFKAVTLNMPGAISAINAFVAAGGGAGTNAYMEAKKFLESINVAQVSKLPAGDPRIVQIAEWGAQRLGLPVVAGALT